MLISKILTNLEYMNREDMINNLKQEKSSLQAQQLKMIGKERRIYQNSIDQLDGILSVIQNGIKPSSRFLKKEEFEELRPFVEKLVNQGEFDENKFRLLYSSF